MTDLHRSGLVCHAAIDAVLLRRAAHKLHLTQLMPLADIISKWQYPAIASRNLFELLLRCGWRHNRGVI